MKVAYILNGTSVYDGSIKSFSAMLQELIDRGIEPLVICPNKKGVYKVLKEKDINVASSRYTFNAFPRIKGFKRFILYYPLFTAILIANKIAYWKISKIIKQFSPQIIHTNVGVINIGYKISQKLGIPHIYHLREYQDRDFGIYILPSMAEYKKTLQADNNYTIAITKDICSYFDLKSHNSSVIYNGIINEQDISNNNDKEDYLLMAGRIDPSKGTLEVVKAFLQYKINENDNQLKLYIAGKIQDQAYYQQICKLIEDNNNIIYLGARSDIDTLIQKAKATIVNSENEGFGRITAEAMINNCLVIGRNSAGTKEQFDNGLEIHGQEIGLRFSSYEELVKMISFAVKESHEATIELAKKTVLQLYTTKANGTAVYAVYSKIIK